MHGGHVRGRVLRLESLVGLGIGVEVVLRGHHLLGHLLGHHVLLVLLLHHLHLLLHHLHLLLLEHDLLLLRVYLGGSSSSVAMGSLVQIGVVFMDIVAGVVELFEGESVLPDELEEVVVDLGAGGEHVLVHFYELAVDAFVSEGDVLVDVRAEEEPDGPAVVSEFLDVEHLAGQQDGL